MKTIKRLTVCLLIFIAVDRLFGDALFENPYLRQAREYQNQAARALEDGDYQAAIDLAAKAQEAAAQSEAYLRELTHKLRAAQFIKMATETAVKINALSEPPPADYAGQIDRGNSALRQAKEQFSQDQFADAHQSGEQAYNALADAYYYTMASRARDAAQKLEQQAEVAGASDSTYQNAKTAMASGLTRFEDKDYSGSNQDFNRAITFFSRSLSAIKKQAKDAIRQALTQRQLAVEGGLDESRPAQFSQAVEDIEEAGASFENERYSHSHEKASQAAASLKDLIASAGAARLLNLAKSQRDLAGSRRFGDPSAQDLEAGESLIEAAEKDLADKDYSACSEKAQQALDIFAPFTGVSFTPEPDNSLLYTVKLIPRARESLWRIAGYEFIYNDPRKWPLIYQANLDIMPQRENPRLIRPGMKLVIPPFKKEARPLEAIEKLAQDEPSPETSPPAVSDSEHEAASAEEPKTVSGPAPETEPTAVSAEEAAAAPEEEPLAAPAEDPQAASGAESGIPAAEETKSAPTEDSAADPGAGQPVAPVADSGAEQPAGQGAD